jgi:hypothetical protein
MMALPFQLMGDIGYFALAGMLGYAYLAWRCIGPGRAAYVAVVMLLASMPYLWELATRSTIVVNMVAALGYLYWLEKHAPRTTMGQIMAGVAGGLVLSTRTVVALPLLVYGVYAYVRPLRIREGVIVVAAAGATFAVTLLPLYFWDAAGFTRSNGLVAGLALVAAGLLGWFSGSFRDVIASAGMVLFVTVLVSFMLAWMRVGFQAVVYGDYFDPSYFNLSLPFLTFALGQFATRDARG